MKMSKSNQNRYLRCRVLAIPSLRTLNWTVSQDLFGSTSTLFFTNCRKVSKRLYNKSLLLIWCLWPPTTTLYLSNLKYNTCLQVCLDGRTLYSEMISRCLKGIDFIIAKCYGNRTWLHRFQLLTNISDIGSIIWLSYSILYMIGEIMWQKAINSKWYILFSNWFSVSITTLKCETAFY